jgi:Icc-related predicted phosphoesterase
MTPWNCPRDVSEEELENHLEDLTSQVNNMEKCVFNIHVPPYGT